MLNPEASIVNAPKLMDILIIGGGLSGIMVAHQIHRTLPTASWKLLEARPILGGRLANDAVTNQIDLGGAWIWPQQQPFVKKLVSSLKIPTFPQPDDPSSTRIDGGAVKFVHAMATDLPMENIMTDSPVTKCKLLTEQCSITSDEQPAIQVETANETFLARHVVIAVPPKLVSLHIHFEPELSTRKQNAMESSQTWMAGVTKISLLYPNRFWNANSSNMGFPGGPAFQVYDASTKDGSINALTFFAVAPSSTSDSALADQVSSQIQKVWNHHRQPDVAKQAKSFTAVHVQRWPLEKYISEDPNPSTINPHPHPVAALSQNEWDNRLLFAGSETDRGSPGVMEGAVSAAMRVVYELQSLLKK